MRDAGLTIRDLVEYLRPSVPASDVPSWPPDAFALAVSILRYADAYSAVVAAWPPGKQHAGSHQWTHEIRALGATWRVSAGAGAAPPAQIARWWREVARAIDAPLGAVRDRTPLRNALLQLVSASDEASNRAGIWNTDRAPQDDFRIASLTELIFEETLGRAVHPSRAVVLPKLHTPQRGMTVRSLTHYLALHEPRGVTPRWVSFPFGARSPNALSVLVLPWPETVVPKDFSETSGLLLNMPTNEVGPAGGYGFFTFDARTPRVTLRAVRSAVRRAQKLVGAVDAVVFPELALAPGQAEAIARTLGLIVIGGEGRAAANKKPGMNQAAVALPLDPVAAVLRGSSFVQPKHHRWCVDRAQILSYGLGAILDPARDWWEHIELPKRELHFFELTEWLTFCVLICEDLARQEPVSDLIRAVGPNLVVSLLMDGPQLEQRWPAKYATVLAEDPGCSVLTLTSVGMATLSRPPGKPVSRAIALWKDPLSSAVEINLPADCDGVVLSLTRERTRERTADGRDDDWGSDYIRLNGVHPVTRGA